jgi:uncharacterized protein involved in outer membrane biogenesis
LPAALQRTKSAAGPGIGRYAENMARWLRYTLFGSAAFAALTVIAIAILVHTVDAERYARGWLEEVRKATGRELRVGGRLALSLFPQPAVVAEDVTIANVPWGSRREMARIPRLEARVALLPLLRGEVRIARLVLVQPDVVLETNAKGENNWTFGGGKPAPKPPAGGQAPRRVFGIEALDVERGRLAYRPHAAEAVQLDVDRLTLEKRTLVEVDDVVLAATLRGQPFTLQGSMGSVAALLARSDAWPVDLAFATSGATASARGRIDWSGATPAANMDVRIEAGDPEGLSKLAGGTQIPTPLAVSAKLAATRGEQRADPIAITVGKTSAAGRVAYRTDGPRPFVSAELKSPGLDLSSGRKVKSVKSTRVFSDAPFPLVALRGLDGDAVITLDRLVLPNGVPLERVDVRAKLKGGRLDVQPIAAMLAGGTVGGSLVVEAAAGRGASIALDVRGKGIQAGQLSAALGRKGDFSGGSTDAAIALRGPGESMRRFMAGANGEIRIVVGPMRVSGLPLEGGGDVLANIADAAMPGRRRDPHTDVQCVVVRLPVRAGIATSQRSMAYETTKVNMVAAGTIDFRTEALDLAIRPTVKEGLGVGVANLAELVKVTGTLANPSIGLDTLGSARAALSVGGAVLTGGLSLLGERLLSSQTGDPAPCRTALGQPAAQSPAPPPKKSEDEGIVGSVRRLFR